MAIGGSLVARNLRRVATLYALSSNRSSSRRNPPTNPKKQIASSGFSNTSRNNRKKYFIARGRADIVSTTPIINKDTKNEFLSFVIIYLNITVLIYEKKMTNPNILTKKNLAEWKR